MRPEARWALAALVLALVVGSLSPAGDDATERVVLPERAEPVVVALDSPSGSEEAVEVDSPLADPEQTRSVDGSVGEGTTSPEPEIEATDAVGGAAPATARPVTFGRRGHVDPGDAPDPQIIATDDGYAVFSTNSGGLNVPVRTSTDLANWTEPVDAAPDLPDWGRPDLTWAPTAAFVGGRWVLYAAVLHDGLGVHCIGAFTSATPVGPYQPAPEPVRCAGRGIIDPYVLVDDGEAYLYWKAVGGRSRQIFGVRLAPDGLSTVGTAVHLATATAGWEGGGVENPAMVRVAGGYVLFYSANWWTDARYAIGYAVCETPLGRCAKATTRAPWVKTTAGVPGPGGQSFTLGRDGRVWMAYHAWTPQVGYQNGGHRRLHVEPVELSTRPAIMNTEPFGTLEGVVPWPGGALVLGWTIDPDRPEPIDAAITVDGQRALTTVAGWPSQAAMNEYPHLGPNHGVVQDVRLDAGGHRVCLVALDDVGILDRELGCGDITFDDTPFGEVTAQQTLGSTVTFEGFAIDPRTAAPTVVEAQVTGSGATVRVRADRPRSGLGDRYPGFGDDHGFRVEIQVPPGDQEVCLRIDPADAREATLRCSRVNGGVVRTPPPPSTASTTSTTLLPLPGPSSSTTTTRPSPLPIN